MAYSRVPDKSAYLHAELDAVHSGNISDSRKGVPIKISEFI